MKIKNKVDVIMKKSTLKIITIYFLTISIIIFSIGNILFVSANNNISQHNSLKANNDKLILQYETYESISNKDIIGGGATYWCNYGSGYYLNSNSKYEVGATSLTSTSDLMDFEWEFIYNDSSHQYFTIRPSRNSNKVLYPKIISNQSECELELRNLPSTLTNLYLWKFVSAGGNNQFYIQNVGNDDYYLFGYASGGICVTTTNLYDDYKIWCYTTPSTHYKNSLKDFSISYNGYMNKNTTQTISIVESPLYALWSSLKYFDFYTANPNIASVDENGKITAVNDGCTMVYIKHRPTGIIKYFNLTVGNIFPSGEYYIINKETGQFIDILGGSTSENASLYLNDWKNKEHTKWNFMSVGNGQYYIYSSHSGKYMGTDRGGSGTLVYQYSSIMDDVYISIRATKSGAYKLCTSNGNSYNGAISSTGLTTDYLCQQTYIEDDNFEDEWLIISADNDLTTVTGIRENSYHFITNVYSQRRLAVSSYSDVNGTNVVTSVKNNVDLQKWKFGNVNTATDECVIYSKYSSSGKVLDVSGSNIDIWQNNNASYQKFKVYRVNILPYESQYIIMYGDKYISEDSSYNVCLTNELTDRSFWSISVDGDYEADLFYFSYDTYDSSSKIEIFKENMEACDFSVDFYKNSTPATMHSILNNSLSNALVFRGHGGAGSLQFYDPTSNLYSYYEVEDRGSTNVRNRYANDLDDNSLAGMNFILLLGCSTGATNIYGDSFIESFYDKGAHFVLGTTDTVFLNDSDDFYESFSACLKNGYTIEESINRALRTVGDVFLPTYGMNGKYPIVFKGNISQEFN